MSVRWFPPFNSFHTHFCMKCELFNECSFLVSKLKSLFCSFNLLCVSLSSITSAVEAVSTSIFKHLSSVWVRLQNDVRETKPAVPRSECHQDQLTYEQVCPVRFVHIFAETFIATFIYIKNMEVIPPANSCYNPFGKKKRL